MIVIRSGLYNIAGGVLRALVLFVSIPLLISYLGEQTYGLWMLISAVIGVVMLAEAGLSTSTTYFCAQDLARDDAVGLSQTLTATVLATGVLATLMATGIYLGADRLIGFFDTLDVDQQAEAVRALHVGVFVVWARLMQQVLTGVMHGFQRFDLSSILGTTQALVNTGGLIGISILGGRIVALMQWQVVTSIVFLVLYVAVCRHLLRPLAVRVRWGWDKVRTIWRYSMLTWTGTLGGVLFSQVDRLIVGKVLGTSVLAVYAAITSTVAQINAFSAMPVQPLLPHLGRLREQPEAGGTIRPAVRLALQINTFIALGLGMMLFTLAPIALEVLLTRPATGLEVAALRLACAIYALYSINGTGYYILFGVNAVRTFMVIQLSGGLLALALIAVGAQAGLQGAVAGNAGYLSVWAFTVLGMKYLGIPPSTWIRWIFVAVIGFAMALGFTLLIPPDVPVLFVTALAQIALLTLWLLWRQPALRQPILQRWIQP